MIKSIIFTSLALISLSSFAANHNEETLKAETGFTKCEDLDQVSYKRRLFTTNESGVKYYINNGNGVYLAEPHEGVAPEKATATPDIAGDGWEIIVACHTPTNEYTPFQSIEHDQVSKPCPNKSDKGEISVYRDYTLWNDNVKTDFTLDEVNLCELGKAQSDESFEDTGDYDETVDAS